MTGRRLNLLGGSSASVIFAYAPAIVVAAGASLLAFATRTAITGATTGPVPLTQLWWITLIPVVEELAFRRTLLRAFAQKLTPLWAVWFTAITFSLAHTDPTFDRIMSLQIGIPFGPFLLGLCCGALYLRTDRIAPAIALHAACNATVPLFTIIDSRWLTWLGSLYS